MIIKFFYLVAKYGILLIKLKFPRLKFFLECSKQGDYKFLLNKSYDIFIDSESTSNTSRDDLIRSNQFRLKCDLTVNKHTNETNEQNEPINQLYQIKWFRLDPQKLLILNDYTQYQLEQLNDPQMSDISIYPVETDLSDEQKLSLSSNLIFNYRFNRDSLLKINGVYLCKLSPKKNQSLPQKPLFFQSVQQVSVNGKYFFCSIIIIGIVKLKNEKKSQNFFYLKYSIFFTRL